MTDIDLAAIEARHHENETWDAGNPRAGADHQVHWCPCSPGSDWPCDTRQVLDVLRAAEAREARLRAAGQVLYDECAETWPDEWIDEESSMAMQVMVRGRTLAALRTLLAEPEAEP